MKVPMTTRVVEWPRQSELTLPSGPKRPMRGPQKNAEMKAVMPPSMWMTLQPAKSIMPMPKRGSAFRIESQPVVDQSLHATKPLLMRKGCIAQAEAFLDLVVADEELCYPPQHQALFLLFWFLSLPIPLKEA
jgi:hypothetical protein